VYVASNIENVLSDGGFSTVFQPHNANILVVTTSSAGCIDNIRFIPTVGVLPVQLQHFTGRKQNGKVQLEWIVSENEQVQQLEIESGVSSQKLHTTTAVNKTAQTGIARYQYQEYFELTGSRFYRLKITDKQNKVSYSGIIQLGETVKNNGQLTLKENPVTNQLAIQYRSSAGKKTISVYNIAGVKAITRTITCAEGNNDLNISLDGQLTSGTYILEIADQASRSTIKFIKQ
jgi:hypothetical protein